MANKYIYMHVLQGDYGHGDGFEDLAQSESFREMRDDLKSYRENAPEGRYRIVRRREPNPDYSDDIVALALSHLEATMIREGAACNDHDKAADYIRLKIGSQKREVFGLLHLDCQHGLIGWESVCFGTIYEAKIYPRELMRSVLDHNSATVILAHNHPSGSCTPSAADRAMTRKVRDMLAVIEVRTLDHIVVSPTGHYSFAANGEEI